MKALLSALVIVSFAAAPALADDCTARQAEINKVFGKRFDRQAAEVRSLAMQGAKLCTAGQTKEGLVKYAEAAKVGGLMAGKK